MGGHLSSADVRAGATARRTLVKGAAWSIPAVVVAAPAPAFAASPCDNRRWSFDSSSTYSRTSINAGRTAATGMATLAAPVPGTSALTIDVKAQTFGVDQMASNSLTTTATGTYGGMPNVRALGIYSSKEGAGRAAGRHEVTFTFSRQVTDLDFTVVDIDDPSDRVDFNGTPFTQNFRGSLISGSGSITDPYRFNRATGGVDSSSTNAMVTVRFPGPISSFTMVFWHTAAASVEQSLYLPPFTFTAKGC